MSTTIRPETATPDRQRGRPPGLRLDPPSGQARRPKLSWMALGLAVVLAGALFGAVTLARVADRTSVLVLDAAIERGATLTDDHLRIVDMASDQQLPLVAGFSVVGLALQPGEYPVAALAPGDRVEVVRTPDPAGTRSDGGAASAVLTGLAEVFAVSQLGETSAGLMVSLTVPQDTGPAIASAAAEGRVRLVLVSSP